MCLNKNILSFTAWTLLTSSFVEVAFNFAAFMPNLSSASSWSSIKETSGVITSVMPKKKVVPKSKVDCGFFQESNKVFTIWYQSRELVAKTFSSTCRHNQDNIMAFKAGIYGWKLHWSEFFNMEWVIECLKKLCSPWKICMKKYIEIITLYTNHKIDFKF